MRLKTLNGAPLCEYLDFSNTSLLEINECNEFQAAGQTPAQDTTAAFKWRRLTSQRLRTGWSQPYLPGSSLQHHQGDLSFSIPSAHQAVIFPEGDTTNMDATATFDEQPSETEGFLQQSFIFHDTLLSSQVLPDAEADNTVASASFLTASFDTTSEFSSPSRIDGHNSTLQIPPTMAVTSLGSLPNARHLRLLYPQTLTRNLLCVLTTNPERREVFVRKGGYKMDLWEVMVADDTRSGFKVSFWIRPPRDSNKNQTNAQAALLQALERVKIGDILLLRNIAITSFRDTVYGQSLNPAITRARTTIDVLLKSSAVSVGHLGGLQAPINETFKRVKRWARTHVAADGVGSRKRKASSTKGDKYVKRTYPNLEHDESLPPDTMESL
ncbi:Nn.00g044010.m01.CDS01 [Neocucurbitaria sp. VM-36]